MAPAARSLSSQFGYIPPVGFEQMYSRNPAGRVMMAGVN